MRIAYAVKGQGDALVLVHGYTGSAYTNWKLSGCFDAWATTYRVVAPDLRGHGRSEKPWRASAYSIKQLASDVLAVMDAEGIAQTRIVGYSLGGMVALELLVEHSERVRAAVIGGMGARLPHGLADGERAPMEPGAPHASAGRGRITIDFLERYLGQLNPLAVAAAYRGIFRSDDGVDTSRLGEIDVPLLCLAGTRDHQFERAQSLAGKVRGARFEALPGETHLSALGAPRFRQLATEFLASV